MFRDARLRRIARFLRSIGIPVLGSTIETATVFPGTLISGGRLVVDETNVVAIGDPLHEAAHIALAPPARRASDAHFLHDADPGEELAAISWCWAASVKLDLEPHDVFHENAYPRGDSQTIIDAAQRRVFIGLPLLQAWGLAFDDETARARGLKPFPHMMCWMRKAG